MLKKYSFKFFSLTFILKTLLFFNLHLVFLAPTLFFLFYQFESLPQFVLQLVDFSLVIWGAVFFLKSIGLLSCFLVIQTEINISFFNQLRNRLKILLKRCTFGSVKQVHFESIIRRYFEAHTKRMFFNSALNEAVFGFAVVVFFSTNLLSYIYLPVYMTFRRLTAVYRFIFTTFCCLQTLGPVIWTRHILQSNRSIVHAKDLFRLLVYYKKESSSRSLKVVDVQCDFKLKWAMTQYYEFFTSKVSHLTFRVGVFGSITKRSVLKVSN